MKKKKNIATYTPQEILGMKSRTDTKRIDAMADEDIDYTDIPELDEKFWKNVRMLRPTKKQMISLRVDKDILGWFKAQGRGYQAYMNAVLRSFVESAKH